MFAEVQDGSGQARGHAIHRDDGIASLADEINGVLRRCPGEMDPLKAVTGQQVTPRAERLQLEQTGQYSAGDDGAHVGVDARQLHRRR